MKVYKKAQQRDRHYTIVPEIRLEGRWLEKIGFFIGSTIQVSVAEQKMVVELIKRDEAKD